MGDRRYGIIHRGRTYLFSGPDERDRFFADPDRYAPVLSGSDVVRLVDFGQSVPGYREHGVFFGAKVYLFADEASLQRFSQNANHYANQALQATQADAQPGQRLR
jgi:protein disulfide-isomerase